MRTCRDTQGSRLRGDTVGLQCLVVHWGGQPHAACSIIPTCRYPWRHWHQLPCVTVVGITTSVSVRSCSCQMAGMRTKQFATLEATCLNLLRDRIMKCTVTTSHSRLMRSNFPSSVQRCHRRLDSRGSCIGPEHTHTTLCTHKKASTQARW